jgi:adenylate cyclase
VLRVVQGWSPDPQVDCAKALGFVMKSLDRDTQDGLALSIGGLVHAYLRKDLKAAGEHYAAALVGNPSEPLAWLFSATRSAYLGEGAEAETAATRALALSPIDPLRYFFDSLAATAAVGNGNWASAEQLSMRSLRANRTHASTWRTLAYAQVMLGKEVGARESVRELLKIEPGFSVSRFSERFPGRDGPMALPWAQALKVAGLPA